MADVTKLVDDLSRLTVLESAELARLLKEKWKPPKVSPADIKNDLPHWPDEVTATASVNGFAYAVATSIDWRSATVPMTSSS
jgi:hypothetical protein